MFDVLWPDDPLAHDISDTLVSMGVVYVGVSRNTDIPKMERLCNAVPVLLVEISQAEIDRFPFRHPNMEILCADIREVDARHPILCWQQGPEHMAKDDAVTAIQRFCSMYDTVVLDMPLGYYEQGPDEDNPYQAHLSEWQPEELQELGFRTLTYFGTADCILAVYP